MLGPDQLGKRVVVRAKVGMSQGRPQFTDVTGELRKFGDGRVVVLRDNGELITVAFADIVAGKQIPPKRARSDRQRRRP